MVCISIPGAPAPLPLEVGLLLLVNKDPKVPQVIELLDWQDQPCLWQKKTRNMVCINIPGDPAPLPLEVGLLLLVNKDPKVPQVIELLDWQDQPDQYIMVLECPPPCEDLFDYVERCAGTLNEDVARLVMWQATYSAYMCCGVFHRDIKLDNLLINPKTLEVKLIDFGCGDLMRGNWLGHLLEYVLLIKCVV
ncbi:serine/threonine-protein kinase pim-1-like [Sinocyclocheilus rhinocerous]|uniref:serine/threonine-protein kinase pim-1-like n=1 Tax=Sinocyclocheilus rhinocerous TaxID=307959 RepID=UPI0007B91820|nr:PREDICTED: serine/threonine-protein kinase pim-1-like [Sinocyclocheilus rhinocerous]